MVVTKRRRSMSVQIRRKRVWTRSFLSTTAADGNLDLLTDFRTAAQFGAQPIGATVARIRVTGQVNTGTTTVFDDTAVGILKFSRNAAAAEVPSPFVDRDEDWMFHISVPYFGDSGVTPAAAPTGRGVVWDIKSMRKIEEAGDTIFFAWDTGVVRTTTWRVAFSVLLLLP